MGIAHKNTDLTSTQYSLTDDEFGGKLYDRKFFICWCASHLDDLFSVQFFCSLLPNSYRVFTSLDTLLGGLKCIG